MTEIGRVVYALEVKTDKDGNPVKDEHGHLVYCIRIKPDRPHKENKEMLHVSKRNVGAPKIVLEISGTQPASLKFSIDKYSKFAFLNQSDVWVRPNNPGELRLRPNMLDPVPEKDDEWIPKRLSWNLVESSGGHKLCEHETGPLEFHTEVEVEC